MDFSALNSVIQSALTKVAEDKKEETAEHETAEDKKDEKAEDKKEEKDEDKKEEKAEDKKEDMKSACLAFLAKRANMGPLPRALLGAGLPLAAGGLGYAAGDLLAQHHIDQAYDEYQKSRRELADFDRSPTPGLDEYDAADARKQLLDRQTEAGRHWGNMESGGVEVFPGSGRFDPEELGFMGAGLGAATGAAVGLPLALRSRGQDPAPQMKSACLAFLAKTACGLSSTPEGKATLEAAEKKDPEGFKRNFDAGLKVEQEHGSDKAEVTTKDHMVENPGYYDAFAKVKGTLEGEKKAWATVHALSAKIAASLTDAKTEVMRKPSPYPPQRGQEKTEPYRNPNTGKPVFNTMQALRKQLAPA